VEVAGSTDISDDRQIGEALEHLAERPLVLADVLAQALLLHHLDVRERDGT
jgi:hypothetical protein